MVHNGDAQPPLIDMRIASNLTQRGTVWYFRARVPEHLVAEFGRKMVSVSLKTGDLNTAKLRARRRREELDRAFEALEPNSTRPDDTFRGTALHMSEEEIAQLCERYKASTLVEDERLRVNGISSNARTLDLDIFESGLPVLRESYARGDLSGVYPSLKNFLKKIDLKIHRQSPAFELLARRFQLVEIQTFEAIQQRRLGVAVPMPAAPSVSLTVDGVYRSWLIQKKSRLPKTVRAFEQAFEEFKSRCDVSAARSIEKKHAVQFRNKLFDENKLSARTVSKHLSFLRAAFQCSVDDGVLEVNPFNGVKVAEDEQEQRTKARVPFSVAELQKIFTSDIYQTGYVARPSLGDACYWLPLLALHSGARLEELAQLGSDSILEHPKFGWYFKIRTEGTRRVKNKNSWRNVPVHPSLLKFGFLQYVTKRTGQLFPALKADKYGKVGTVFSTWFGLHLTTLGIVDERKVFHSFRHTFIQVCKTKSLQIPPEVREAMVGHVSADKISAEYGEDFYPLDPQVLAMKCIDFSGLELGHLVKSKPSQEIAK